MGERHQMFVIARRGPRYRTLAVVHHQWLYGKVALMRCLRLLRIFSHKFNRISLEQELNFSAIENEQRDANAGSAVVGGSPHPFPFITTCLYLGSVCDPGRGELCSRAFVENPTMGYDEGDNNTGITIIDITDLDRIQYCFVAWDLCRNDKPLTANEYVRLFEDFDQYRDVQSTEVHQLLNDIESFGLIPLETLKDCWPKGKWLERDTSSQAISCDVLASPKKFISSLRDMATAKLITELISRGDDVDVQLLDHPLQIPGMRRNLIAHCRQHADSLVQTSSMATAQILAVLFSYEKEVDLSPYHQMTPRAMRFLLNKLKAVRVLNLSGTLASSDMEISQTLTAIDHDLDELYILVRPDRETDNPMAAFQAVSRWSFGCRKLVLGSVLAQAIAERPWLLDYNDEFKIQTQPDFPITVVDSSASANITGLLRSFPVIQLLLQGPGIYEPATHETYFLGDAFLNPTRFAVGIFNFIRSRIARPWLGRTGSAVAHAFASAGSSLRSDVGANEVEVGALPAETIRIGRRCDSMSSFEAVHCRLRDLVPNAWTAILIQETRRGPVSGSGSPSPDSIWFKLALVRSKRPILAQQSQKVQLEDLEVVDLEKFLAMTSVSTGLTASCHASDLKHAIGRLEEFAGYCSPQETMVWPLDAPQVLASLEQAFSRIDADEKARETARRRGRT